MLRLTPLRPAAVCSLLLLSVACSSDDGTPAGPGDVGVVPDVTQAADFVAGGSIGQVWITDAEEGDELILADSASLEIARGTADELGSLILRDVPPADGYTIRRVDLDGVAGTEPFRVPSPDDPPDPSLYEQRLQPGLNYVRMRDGIELAMTVRLPSGLTLEDGPFPTVIEHSGYQVAAPGDLWEAALQAVGGGGGLDGLSDPLLPATSTAVGSLIAPLLGYATVSVQMRGSGCSGGDFQLFDLPTTYDGYDAVEIVAAQPWVRGGKVGMVGISFSGISQLFAAGARPPSLAAVTPLSVTDDIYRGTGFPGGIFNNGFAASWLRERQENARPAPEEGALPYAIRLVEDGDERCTENQKLRLQTEDIFGLVEDNPFRTPAVLEPRTPARWAESIEVPVFLVGAFQDEQTGGHFPQMVPVLDDNPDVWITLMNGVHSDALGPAALSRWVEFLDLFVADRIPEIPPTISSLSGQLYSALAAGSPSMPLPPLRFDAVTDVAAARAEFRRDPRVRLLMDSGAGEAGPGGIAHAWELDFDAWPPRPAEPVAWHLAAGGLLSPEAAGSGEVRYTGDPSRRPATSLGGSSSSDPWAALPAYDWAPVAEGAGLGFITEPLAEDHVIVGASSLDLRLRSSAPDTDLQVTLSDVRPDGEEMYVQSGWLRASHRALDAARSTETSPVHTHLEEDAAELPAGAFETVRVQIHPVAHAFRAGHRIRVTIQAPGGDRPRWRFDTIEDGTIENTIELGASRLVLPVVPGLEAGAPMPPCPGNRGQPCRAYVAASNGG